jgi:two-component system phosphate regulon sensor histidine kinase PhoR
MALVEVDDTGVGIAEEHQPRIFERFYRADQARSRELGGTGLGLSIVKNLVNAFGGSIKLNSKLGKGSTFSIRIPLA